MKRWLALIAALLLAAPVGAERLPGMGSMVTPGDELVTYDFTSTATAGIYTVGYATPMATLDFELGSAFSGVLYQCDDPGGAQGSGNGADSDGDGDLSDEAACSSLATLSASTSLTSMQSVKVWWVIDINTAESAGNSSRLTIKGTWDQVTSSGGGGNELVPLPSAVIGRVDGWTVPITACINDPDTTSYADCADNLTEVTSPAGLISCIEAATDSVASVCLATTDIVDTSEFGIMAWLDNTSEPLIDITVACLDGVRIVHSLPSSTTPRDKTRILRIMAGGTRDLGGTYGGEGFDDGTLGGGQADGSIITVAGCSFETWVDGVPGSIGALSSDTVEGVVISRNFDSNRTSVNHEISFVLADSSIVNPSTTNSSIAWGENDEGCTNKLVQNSYLEGYITLDVKSNCGGKTAFDDQVNHAFVNSELVAYTTGTLPRLIKLQGDGTLTGLNSKMTGPGYRAESGWYGPVYLANVEWDYDGESVFQMAYSAAGSSLANVWRNVVTRHVDPASYLFLADGGFSLDIQAREETCAVGNRVMTTTDTTARSAPDFYGPMDMEWKRADSCARPAINVWHPNVQTAISNNAEDGFAIFGDEQISCVAGVCTPASGENVASRDPLVARKPPGVVLTIESEGTDGSDGFTACAGVGLHCTEAWQQDGTAITDCYTAQTSGTTFEARCVPLF